jgi:hypothetical protein
MKRILIGGVFLLVAGIAQMIGAGAMDVTTPADPSIANTDLMLQREMYFIGGGFAFIAGVILLAAERVCAHLRRIQDALAVKSDG